jgi:magnesium-transporting ATPase (P-type)
MAIVNTVVRVTGGLVVAIFQYFSDKSFYELMMMNGTAEVLRGGEMILINQTDVVPGDIVRLKPGLAYFDMALLQSNHLLVDESSLTGEVNPIAKLPLDASKNTYAYDAETDKVSTISAGTTILECGEEEGALGDLAIVTQTGSFTAKGELLCDVLSYERHKFKFDTEVKLVLGILAVEGIALVTMVFSFIESDNWVYSWFYAMFVVGAVLPPLLPTVFVVSVGISCKRLQDIRITCSDSQGILVAGKVKKCFFDKVSLLSMRRQHNIQHTN